MRIFTAFPLPDDAIAALESYYDFLRENFDKLKLVDPKNLHITLHFFGELAPNQVQDLISLMHNSEALQRPAITSYLMGMGQFPPKGQPRVIYTPLGKGAQDIINYQQIYSKEIQSLGYKPEKKREFKVHITLARNKFQRVPPGALDKFVFQPFEFTLNRLVLFESRLSSQGAQYMALEELELTKFY